MKAVAARLTCHLRNFASGEAGNVATIFALAIIPIFGLIGASIDYSQASSVRANLQAAIDSTALMISKTAVSKTASELQASATAFFNQVFTDSKAQGATVIATYTSDGGSAVKVTGSASVPTSFLGMFGFDNLGVAASSTVKWGNTRLRVALVLDVTGSMASAGKMTALKTASKNLVTQLKNAAVTNGDVYVSIVPFAKDVNVGAASPAPSWISWTLWDAANGKCSRNSERNNTQSECLADKGKWTPASRSTWNGCVTDRDQNYDTNNAAPVSTTPGTLFPAEQYSYCPVAMIGLTYNWTNLNSKIDSMQPNGGTNQVIGLQWGFQSLTNAPFTIPSEDPKYTYKKVIILLSDGLNTQNRWYGNGVNPSPQVDDRQRILCNNVKAAGITLYTVQVNTDGDPTSTLLKECASSPDKFFLLTSANQMVATFNQIGTALTSLRIAM